MCGISGFVGVNNLPEEESVNNTLRLMKERRGPDSSGKYAKTRGEYSLLFLQSRLSIIDPKPRSDQPMEDDEGVLSFSGEIFNYLELRDLCKSKGANFKTESDTEVLLKMLNIFNTKAIELLNGDWVFSYYNKKNDTIIISRDRFGVRPLFYFSDDKNFYFSTNINHLIALTGKKIKINPSKIKSFLNFGFRVFSSGKETFFSDIYNFPAANYLVIKNFKFNVQTSLKKYWNPKIQINNKLSYEDSVELVKSKLIESTKFRLRSDFPIACLLSGGIDSSAISGISKKIFNNDLHYFSYKPKNENYDETDLIQENLKSLGGKHEYVELDFNDNLKELKNLIMDGGYPLNSLSSFAFHRLCKEMKIHDYRVVLSGVGGDELFAGNYIDHLNYLVSIKNDKIFKTSFDHWEKNIKPIIRTPALRDFNDYYKKINDDENITWHEKDIIKSYLKFNLKNNKFEKKNYSKDFFRNELSRCLFEETVPSHLFSMDQISMYHSIEGRYPFLCPNLYEAVNTIPSEFLMKKSLSKSVLRDSLTDKVPDKVLKSKNKIGFYCDISEMFEMTSKKFQDLIFHSKELNSLVEMNAFKKLLQKKKIDVPELKLIFNFLNLAIMYEIYD